MSDQTLPSIPGYILSTQLYGGQRTAVYRAISETHGDSVIIKILRSHHPSISELVRFRNQYIITKNLAIPSIIAPLALVPWNHSYALVMEDVGGIALRDYLKIHGRLSVEEIMAIGLQLADSLHQLSQHRVLHKDINPANILIHPDTHRIWLTDFSLASLLPKENQELQSPHALEGTLAYIAPEQTGRMNRGIDYRTDFYSLGVTLYELLTGKLPFQSDDSMELIHCHIAKMPVSPGDFQIPNSLSNIVLKLMAKNAEDRYQSALGLKHDLQRCLGQWQISGQIEGFELGAKDRCDRFLIPEKLYGRTATVQTLLDAFDRVSQGASELMLVAGFSGIGKTAVVNEVHKPITRQNGYFIKGKFDQFNRNVPFSAFCQAFRSLMAQLLSESDAALGAWKASILAAIGGQGQVLIEVIPELALIIGPQPEVPELTGMAAQNRFSRLLGQFIQVFTSPDHPLTIFLDDLQWADSASLTLLKLIMTQAETGYLWVLGAYRNNQVSAAHPLMLTLDELRHATVHTLTLTPLNKNDIHRLVAESLRCSVEIATPLAQLVEQKTQGNPFFATQFLQSLQADGWIRFHGDVGYWQCDLSQVRPLALTHDVVEFMVRRLRQWPQTTQQALAIAACLGNQFDLDTLAIVCATSPADLAHSLWPALQAGLLIPKNETYKFFQGPDGGFPDPLTTSHGVTVTYRFLHDRVQQAAYAFIPKAEKQQTHYQIGRFLLDHGPQEKQDDDLFNIVNQLNIGRDLVSCGEERHQLIGLNLRAGIKAKSATAYGAALDYFDTALAMLSTDSWQQNYFLTLELHENAAEVAALAGHGERMEARVQTVMAQAKTSLDTVKTLQVKMQYCLGQNQPQVSLEIGRSLLQTLGVDLPESPTLETVQQELKTFKQFAAQFSFDEIVALPVLTDPNKLAIASTLILVITPLMIVDPNLFLLVVLMTTQFSLTHGNAPSAAYGYALYAILVKNLEQDIDIAHAWGNLAVRVLHTSNSKVLENRVYHTISAFITHEKQHVEETLNTFQQAYTNGVDNGDFEFSGYSIYLRCYNLYFLGRELSSVRQANIKTTRALSSIGQNLPVSWSRCFDQTIIQLSATTDDAHDLSDNPFDAEAYVQSKQEQHDGFGLCYFYFNQATVHYVLGNYSQALASITLAEQYLAGLVGMLTEVMFYFYDSLIRLACAHGPDAVDLLAKVRENQQKMKRWANTAPMNFRHKYELVCAEEQRLLGNRLAAMDYYDCAIAGAQANGYLQEQAIANELAAQFYFDWGKKKIATVYFQDAYYGYDRWGAKAKTQDMAACYADLLQPVLRQINTIDPLATLHHIAPLHLSAQSSDSKSPPVAGNFNTALDLATIFKSVQALSESIDLTELFNTLAPMMLQTSGAERLILLLPDPDSTWRVRVTATTDTIQLGSDPLTDNPHLPVQLLQYVQHTQEILQVDGLDHPLSDPYLQQHPHRSVLCLPLLHQSKLMGLMYLDHHSVAGVFSRDRIAILNVLCTQAAISLENALLNQSLEQKIKAQTKELSESETRLKNMINNIPGVVYQFKISAAGEIDSIGYISPDCYDLYEVTAEAFMGGEYGLRDFEHSEDRPIIDQMLTDRIPGAQTFQHEFRIITPSGTLKWIQVFGSSRPQPDGTGLWDGVVLDVSDRKATELALQDAEAQFRRMTENLPGMVYRYILHADGSDELTYVSAQVRELFELEPEIALQGTDKVWGRIHPDDIPWLGETIQASAENLQPFTSAYRLILPEKGIRWVQNMTSVERLDNGDVVWDGIVMDISDRKAIEKSLNLTQAAVDKAALEIFYIREDGSFLQVNEAACAGLGYSHDELTRLYVWDINPDMDSHDWPYYWNLLQQNSVAKYEVNHQRKDGSLYPVEIVSRYLEYDGEGISFAQVQNISDRRDAALALEKEVLRRNTIFNASGDGIHIIDRQGNLIEANATFFKNLGYTPEAGRHLNIMDWDVGFSREEIQAKLQTPPSEIVNQVVVHETLHQRKDGSIFPIEVSVSGMEWNGQLAFICTARDISERKQAEAQLQQTLAQLEASNNELEAFAYSVSHDLRAPLRAINGFSQALLEDYGELFDEDSQYYFERIQANTNRMGDLIDDLLKLSQVACSDLAYTTVNLSTQAWEILHDLQSTEPDRQVDLIIASDITVCADAGLMRVVLMNLLQNAWKFTSHHDTARIEFGISSPEASQLDTAETTYFIKDDGAGFDPAYHHKLFGIFQRLHAAEEFPGTGIGLATVQRAIHRHGGQVWANAAVEQGATFCFTLPPNPNRLH